MRVKPNRCAVFNNYPSTHFFTQQIANPTAQSTPGRSLVIRHRIMLSLRDSLPSTVQTASTAQARLTSLLSSVDPRNLFTRTPKTLWDDEIRELTDRTYDYISTVCDSTVPTHTRNPYRANTGNTRTADELFNLRLTLNAATSPDYDPEEDIDSYIRCRNREGGAGADSEAFVTTSLIELEVASGAGTQVEDSIPQRMRHLSQHLSTLTSRIKSTGDPATPERTDDHSRVPDQTSLSIGLVSVGLAGLGLYLWSERTGTAEFLRDWQGISRITDRPSCSGLLGLLPKLARDFAPSVTHIYMKEAV